MIETRYSREFGASNEQEYKIYGYAARYGTIADIGDFDETLEPGCFERCVREMQDVRCLLNHDTNIVLGRTRNDTLRLKAETHGLYFECQLNPESEQHRNVYASVQRGDLSECSFMFTVPNDNGQSFEMQGNGKPLRRVKDLNLFEVSPVAFPAYKTGTSVQARQFFDADARSALAVAMGRANIVGPTPEPTLANLDEVRDMVYRWRAEDFARIVAADRAGGRI
jgi:HK97 family phage prohead protease